MAKKWFCVRRRSEMGNFLGTVKLHRLNFLLQMNFCLNQIKGATLSWPVVCCAVCWCLPAITQVTQSWPQSGHPPPGSNWLLLNSLCLCQHCCYLPPRPQCWLILSALSLLVSLPLVEEYLQGQQDNKTQSGGPRSSF